jgi:hypothetical protein
MKSASALSIVETSRSMKYEAKEGHIMYAIVHHRVMDREKFLATDPQDIAGKRRLVYRCVSSFRLEMHPPPIACGRPSRLKRFATISIRSRAGSVRTRTSRSTRSPRSAFLSRRDQLERAAPQISLSEDREGGRTAASFSS